MSRATAPSFFIVGAPKCGTTAMSTYLGAHPNVFMAYPKEPHHFATDLSGLSRIERRSDYLALFDDRTDEHLAVGEASVWYLFSREAIPAIRDFNPDARIVVMLRDPADFLRSYHNQLVFSLIESETDFRVAWALQQDRAQGRHLPLRCRLPEALQYGAAARFGEQVHRLLAAFPREQVHFIFFEDFVTDPRRVYVDLLEFLGVPDDGRREFPRINAARASRSRLAATLLLNPPAPLRVAWRALKHRFGPSIIRYPERLLALNAKAKKPTPFDPDLGNFIRVELRDDIVRLAGLVGRNLDSWLPTEDRTMLRNAS